MKSPNHGIREMASNILSVVRQKGEFRMGANKKTKHTKFSEKRTFTRTYQGVRNVRFFRKFGVLCFLVTSRFDIRLFALLPTIFDNNPSRNALK